MTYFYIYITIGLLVGIRTYKKYYMTLAWEQYAWYYELAAVLWIAIVYPVIILQYYTMKLRRKL